MRGDANDMSYDSIMWPKPAGHFGSIICHGTTYRWPSPNRQGVRVRASSSADTDTEILTDTDDDDSDTDTITGIEMKNSCERLDSALNCNAGASPRIRVATLVDLENTASSVAGNAATEKDIRQSDQNPLIHIDLTRLASPSIDSQNTAPSVADNSTTEKEIQQSHRRTSKNPAGTGRAEGGIQKKQKKRASVGRKTLFEFSRLGQLRRGADRRIQYEIHWEPTWGTLEDFEGSEALNRARELTVGVYGSETWAEEMRKSGHLESN